MRWIFRIVAVLVVIALAIGAFLVWLPADTIARLAAARFTEATGRKLSIAGDVSATIWPTLGVTANTVTLANRDGGQADNLMTAERIYIGIDPLTIFNDTVAIRSIELVSPEINLERGSDGSTNWTFFDSGTGSAGSSIAIDKISLKRGKIRYSEDGKSGVAISDVSGDLTLSNASADLEFAATYNGQPVSGTVSATNLAGLIAGTSDIETDIKVGESTLLFRGAVTPAEQALAGSLRIEMTDRGAVLGFLGIPNPVLPSGFGRDRIAVIADLDLAGDRASLSNLSLNLDQNHFTGRAVIDFADRPLIDADLFATIIDFSALAAPSGGSADWSDDPLPVGIFSQFDAALNLAFTKGTIGTLALGDSAMRIVLNGGEAEAEISRLALFDGAVSGTVIADFRNTPTLTARLHAEDLSTEEIGTELAGSDRLLARADGDIDLSGAGRSIAAIVPSLAGSGSIRLGNGELRGVDLATMLRKLDPIGQSDDSKTIIDGATATFVVKQGVLTNSDLALTAPILLGSGQGDIGLAGRTIDYTFIAKLPANVIGRAVELPIHIGGSWSNPQIRLDMADLIAARYGVDLETLGEAAANDLRGKISDELGIDIAPGQDLKAALSAGLEKKALEALSKGLSDNGVQSSAPAVEQAPPLNPRTDNVDLKPDTQPVPASGSPLTSPVPKLRPMTSEPASPAEPVLVIPTPVQDLPTEETPTAETPVEEPTAEQTSEPTTAPEEPSIADETPAAEEPVVTEPPAPEEPAILPCPAEITGETALPCTLPDGTLFSR